MRSLNVGEFVCSIVFLLAGYFVCRNLLIISRECSKLHTGFKKAKSLMIPLYTIELQKLRDSYPPSERNSFENLFLVALEQLVYFLEEIRNMLWGVGPAYGVKSIRGTVLMFKQLEEFGTPSVPPVMEVGREESSLGVEAPEQVGDGLCEFGELENRYGGGECLLDPTLHSVPSTEFAETYGILVTVT
ncbi:Protein Ycf2 [Linum perenne]